MVEGSEMCCALQPVVIQHHSILWADTPITMACTAAQRQMPAPLKPRNLMDATESCRTRAGSGGGRCGRGAAPPVTVEMVQVAPTARVGGTLPQACGGPGPGWGARCRRLGGRRGRGGAEAGERARGDSSFCGAGRRRCKRAERSRTHGPGRARLQPIPQLDTQLPARAPY
jgi:hypothetical protein